MRFLVDAQLPPALARCLVWVPIGNTTRRELLAWFAELLPDIERALVAGERLIEVSAEDRSGTNPAT